MRADDYAAMIDNQESLHEDHLILQKAHLELQKDFTRLAEVVNNVNRLDELRDIRVRNRLVIMESIIFAQFVLAVCTALFGS